jgi:ubiquinone/menaquinone biosynthesis C-methylase UbiE
VTALPDALPQSPSRAEWPSRLLAMVAARPELQPWDDHVALRAIELDEVRAAVSGRRLGRLLEVGTGNGFGSAYVADLADMLIATDLPRIDVATHSIGLALTQDLLSTTQVTHARLVGCSGEALPFATSSVDSVLGLYSLEHVPDKARCLRETSRVLADEGVALFTVPAAAWSTLYPSAVYGGLLRRILTRSDVAAEAVMPSGGEASGGASLWRRFRRSYPHFPVPEPHGAFPGFFTELRLQLPSRWVSLFEENGLRVREVRALAVVPHLLLTSLFGRRGFELYLRLRPLDRWLCRRRRAWRFAQFLLIVAEPQ